MSKDLAPNPLFFEGGGAGPEMQLPLPWIMNQERFSSKGRWGWGSSAECISLESTEGGVWLLFLPWCG